MVCFGIDPGDCLVLQYNSPLDAVVAEPSVQPVHGFIDLLPFLAQPVVCDQIQLYRTAACGQIGHLDAERTKRTLLMIMLAQKGQGGMDDLAGDIIGRLLKLALPLKTIQLIISDADANRPGLHLLFAQTHPNTFSERG